MKITTVFQRPPCLRPEYKITKRFVATVVREDPVPAQFFDCPERMLAYWRSIISTQPDYEPDKESLCVVCLTARLHPFSWQRVSLGTVNECTAHPRDILKPVICASAQGFVVMHNHPSGDPSPSQADSAFTKRLREAAELMQIRFVDHIIATDPERVIDSQRQQYFSFREAGYL